MTKNIGIHITLALLVLGAVAPVASADDEVEVLPLERIIENPIPYRDLTVGFIVQFHRIGHVDVPFYTRFERNWYANFSVWPDSSQLWKKAQYRNDFSNLFIARHKKAANTILHAPTFSRWLVTGHVSDIFRGKPYIEVLGLQRLDDAMKKADIINLVKGYRFNKFGNYSGAASQFANVNGDWLPAKVRSLAMYEEARNWHLAGNHQKAIERTRKSLGQWPDDARALAALRKYNTAAGLDENGKPLEATLTKKDAAAPAANENAKPSTTSAPATKPKTDVHPLLKKEESKSAASAGSQKEAKPVKKINMKVYPPYKKPAKDAPKK